MFEEEVEPDFEIFSSLLFNALKAITFMFFISFAMINPTADTGKVDPKAELMITVTWPDNNTDDVDTYVADPAGNIVWYNRREAGLMHLDRDDRGIFKDVLIFDGKEVERTKRHEFDGLIYMMFRQTDDQKVLPLYIGKAETLGKGDGNLSANLLRLAADRSKFARWGDNYQYHIGNLSAACLHGHAVEKISPKYARWASVLFEDAPCENPRLRHPLRFWAKAWKSTDIGIWSEMNPTRLTFLEYLLIGVASATFGSALLNSEGRNR